MSPVPDPCKSMRNSHLGVALSLLAALLILAGPAGAASWKGTETVENGVTHVMNPANGMHAPMTIELEELWRIGGDTDDEDEFFGLIVAIDTDAEGNVYVLDLQLAEVKIYSPDGEFIRSIGREGEGPGEFRFPSGLAFLGDGNIGVVQTAPGRIVLLTPDGEPAGDLPVPSIEGGGSAILRTGRSAGGELYLLLQINEFGEGKLDQTLRVVRVDDTGEIAVDFTGSKRTFDFASAMIDEKVFDGFENRWALGHDGRVFTNEAWGDYEITIYAADGTKQRVVKREYPHRERPKEELDYISCIFTAFTRQVPNSQISISDYDQDIFRLYTRNDGTLWVNTSMGSRNDLPEGILGGFDVYDEQGHFLREVSLKGEGEPGQDAYFFVGDRLYVVRGMLEAAMVLQTGGSGDCVRPGVDPDAEPEPMSVICYQLNAKDIGG